MMFASSVSAYAFGPSLFAGGSNANVDIMIKLHDLKMIEMIKSGMRSLSPSMKMSKFECSICKEDYEVCPHEEEKLYDGKECHATALDLETQEVSLVDKPLDPRAQITDFLILENSGNSKIYTWYGFKIDYENRRFKHIQKACDKGLISENMALRLSNFFLSNPEGTMRYP